MGAIWPPFGLIAWELKFGPAGGPGFWYFKYNLVIRFGFIRIYSGYDELSVIISVITSAITSVWWKKGNFSHTVHFQGCSGLQRLASGPNLIKIYRGQGGENFFFEKIGGAQTFFRKKLGGRRLNYYNIWKSKISFSKTKTFLKIKK